MSDIKLVYMNISYATVELVNANVNLSKPNRLERLAIVTANKFVKSHVKPK